MDKNLKRRSSNNTQDNIVETKVALYCYRSTYHIATKVRGTSSFLNACEKAAGIYLVSPTLFPILILHGFDI